MVSDIDVNVRDEHAACPLHEASAKGHAAVVQQLLAANAVAAVDCEGKEPLHWAASRGHTAVAKILPAAGAAEVG